MIIDEMRVLSLSRPRVPREDGDLPYLLVWVVITHKFTTFNSEFFIYIGLKMNIFMCYYN